MERGDDIFFLFKLKKLLQHLNYVQIDVFYLYVKFGWKILITSGLMRSQKMSMGNSIAKWDAF